MTKPDSTPAPGAANFDHAGMMDRLMNDEDLIRTLLDGFLEDMPTQIGALQANLDAGSQSGVELKAHTIKGAASNVGGERLVQIATEIEQAGKRGDMARASALMAELRSRMSAFSTVAGTHLAGGENAPVAQNRAEF
jgi:HPt (histidine-containing phosphotransfer) domain-containing protein